MGSAIINKYNVFPRCFHTSLLRVSSHSFHSSVVIYDFLLFLYITGKDLTFLKYLGLADLLINKGLNFSEPSTFTAKSNVTRSLLSFPPWHFSFLNVSVQSGKHFKKIPSRQHWTHFSDHILITSLKVSPSSRHRYLHRRLHFFHKFFWTPTYDAF